MVLVIAPASMRSGWQNDLIKFGATGRWVVESYDVVARRWQDFTGPWGAIVIDEAHYLKSPSILRTSAIYGAKNFPGLINMAGHVWALTGTPTPNDASEMHTHMAALFPESLAMAAYPKKRYSRDQFVRRYCKTRESEWGLKVYGSKNLDDLRARLNPHLLRRTKKEVLPDLPTITYEPLLFDAPDALTSLVEIPGDEAAALRDALKDGDAASLQALAPGLASLRRVTALAKTEIVLAWAKDFLASTDRKLVIFGHHTAPLERIADHFRKVFKDKSPPMILGNTRSDGRASAVRRFQEDPEARLFVGQIQAAGTGITLTAASDLLFLEQSWVPAENSQAAQRIHRIGQTRGCMVRYAALAGSIDEAVQRVLERKTKMVSDLFG